MNLEKYRYVLNYFRQFEPDTFKDLCHTAYLNFWKRTQSDLFDQEIGLIFRVIKNQAIEDWRKKEQITSREDLTVYVNKTFVEVDPDLPLLSRNNPYQELIAKELLEKCYQLMVVGKRNTKRAIEILELKLAGYGENEISRLLGITNPAVCRYTKNLEMLTNPINGSRLKITKQISLGTWEKRTDQEDYVLEDYNEFYRLYQHKESKEGLLVKLPAGKHNQYIK